MKSKTQVRRASNPDLFVGRYPKARDDLRRVLIRDQPDRDALASELIHYGDQAGFDWADIIDALTMHPDQRRRVVRLLGELEAG